MKKLLLVTAHPDDETICAGGTLALLARRGVAITILCSTRGEGGVCGDPSLCLPQGLGAVRERELRCAAAALGVSQVLFLGYVDPPVGPGNLLRAATDDLDEFASRIRAVVERVRPQVVLTHGSNGEYGHPQHGMTHRAVKTALAGPRSVALYTFAAAAPAGGYFGAFRNPDDPPTLTVDISQVLGDKHRAFACHATQVATTVRDAGLATMDGMFPPCESFRRWRGRALLEAWLG
jgi:N-acetylglucosamine malate deacetylase 2